MSQIVTLALPFFGLIFLGFFAGRWFRDRSDLGWLNLFVLYFALPALFFRIVSRTPVDEIANPAFVMTTTLATFTVFLVALAIGLVAARGDLRAATIQAGLGAYANVGYMGPGLTLAVFGPAAAVPTALIFSFDSMLMFTLVPLLMAVAASDRHALAPALGGIAWRIVTQPFIVATALGALAAYSGLEPPLAVARLLDMLSGAAAPCALFAIGITVAQRPLRRVPAEMPFLVLCKLVLHPALALGLLVAIGGFAPLWVATAVLMAALPAAVSMYVFAEQYGVYVERASSTILVSTAASVASVTGLLYLIAGGFLPTGAP